MKQEYKLENGYDIIMHDYKLGLYYGKINKDNQHIFSIYIEEDHIEMYPGDKFDIKYGYCTMCQAKNIMEFKRHINDHTFIDKKVIEKIVGVTESYYTMVKLNF